MSLLPQRGNDLATVPISATCFSLLPVSTSAMAADTIQAAVSCTIAIEIMVSDRIVLYFPEITNKQKAELPNPKFSLFACHQ